MPYHCIFVEEHIKSLAKFTNNRVVFFSSETTLKNGLHERIDSIENEVTVTRFYFNQKLNRNFLNLYMRLVAITYFLKLIYYEKYKPDILHYHFFQVAFSSEFLVKIFKIKYVVTEHWTAFVGFPLMSKDRFTQAKKVFNNASAALPVSIHLKNGIEESTGATISSKSTVINNSVDTKLFNLRNPDFTSKQNNLISVVRLDEQKDIPTMLKTLSIALASKPDLKLNIIGGGDSKPFIEITESLQIKHAVEFLGPLPKTKIAELMNQSNLFILSSISENSPCVIGEAHCCGLPVVATDVGGVKELIMEGAVVPPKSPELLAAKILEQLDKKVDRAALAQKAQARFSYDAIGQQIFEVYQKVCAE